jgi:hypothetical protein
MPLRLRRATVQDAVPLRAQDDEYDFEEDEEDDESDEDEETDDGDDEQESWQVRPRTRDGRTLDFARLKSL